MTDQQMLEQVRITAGPCPSCGCSVAKPIFWGYPDPMEYDRLGDRVSWGGCCLPDEPKAYVCGSCGEEYGVAGPDSDEELDSGVPLP